LVEVSTGRVSNLTRDRAIDQQPAWSPEGRWVFFTSDRTGIANVYAYDLMTLELFQVTNVLGGAYMPEVSPDGRTLFYVGYTADGFDLYSMPLDRSRWLEAVPANDSRPQPTRAAISRPWPVVEYSALPTLRPHAYSLEVGPGTFGQALRIATRGSDAARLHSFGGSLTIQSGLGGAEFSLGYSYQRLPFSVGAELSRTARPRSYSLGVQEQSVTEWTTSASTWLSFPELRAFDTQSVSVAYSVSRFGADLPVGPTVDPYATVPVEPFRGILSTLSFGYSYSNVEGSYYGISPEKGYRLGASLEVANEATASEATLTSLTARARAYVTLPWLRHHVLALAASGGSSAGSYTRGGLFYTGGFVGENVRGLLDSFFDSAMRQRVFVLRGYEPGGMRGSDYLLLNAEYRLPIAYIDRGWSALPLYFRTLSMAAFADYGGAFDRVDLEKPLASYHLGIGAEMWLSLVWGYRVRGTVRVGHARGTDSKAVKGGQTYVVIASPF
jgi:outer membrane protein assembly factor BamA